MVLTDQRFEHSDVDLRETGFMVLTQSLGYADTLRFLNQLIPGQGDYLEWQEKIFGNAGVDEIYKEARKHWSNLKAKHLLANEAKSEHAQTIQRIGYPHLATADSADRQSR